MALPTKTDLEKLDFVYKGQPFCDTYGKKNVDIRTMDWAYQAQPFVSNMGLTFYYQTLATIEITVLSLTKTMIWTKILAMTERTITLISKMITYFKKLVAVTGAKIPEVIFTTGGQILKKIKRRIYQKI